MALQIEGDDRLENSQDVIEPDDETYLIPKDLTFPEMNQLTYHSSQKRFKEDENRDDESFRSLFFTQKRTKNTSKIITW